MKLVPVSKLLTLAALQLGAFVSHAAAHSPYFSRLQPIALPGGEQAEVGALHGDGIFIADPVRIVVLAGGRAIARSYQAVPWVLSCDALGSCLIIDLGRGVALDLDPASFRPGPEVVNTGDREKLWDLEAGNETWGFRTRPVSRSEWLSAYALHVAEMRGTFALLAFLGGIGTAIALFGIRIPRGASVLRYAGFALLLLVRLACALVLLGVSMYIMVLVGVSLRAGIAAIFAGAVAAQLLRRGSRALRRRGAPAA